MSLDSVGAQMDLARAVLASGKPTVVVLIHGSPLVIPELAQKAPAILDGFYLGEEDPRHGRGQRAFRRGQPRGPAALDRAPFQRRYIPTYYNHKPLAKRLYLFEEPGPQWAFGHGLSYTTFRYAPLKLSPARIAPDGTAAISVAVTNTGERTSDEVVQLYLHNQVASVTPPVKESRAASRASASSRARRSR